MKFNQIKKIILASGSPRRREYLERYGLNYRIIKPEIDETAKEKEEPEQFAKRMAKEKLEAIIDQVGQDEIALSADTIVVFEGKILGKPTSKPDAYRMLQTLNGNTHSVITAYALLNAQQNDLTVKAVCTKVTFNQLDDSLLKAYADSEEPQDKAGSYSIQGDGTFLVNRIEGSYNNVVGLPIEQVFLDFINASYITLQ